MAGESKATVAIVWFRKGLRLHDNPALAKALAAAPRVLPIFCLDPQFVYSNVMRVGVRRWVHLLETLEDLDRSLRRLGSRLLVLRGDPLRLFPAVFSRWKPTHLFFEADTEPYAEFRDAKVRALCSAAGVEAVSCLGHTLWDPKDVVKANKGKVPLTYRAFQGVVEKMPAPSAPLDAPTRMPAISDDDAKQLSFPSSALAEPTGNAGSPPDSHSVFVEPAGPASPFSVPTAEELKLRLPPEDQRSPHPGGETEALRRLDSFLAQTARAAKFEKPETSPAMMHPNASTTVLSPYLKFGSLSARLFRSRLLALYSSPAGKGHSQPPVSLWGQLLWREFYYCAATTPGYNLMATNPVCLQVPWRLAGPSLPANPTAEDRKAMEHLEAWTNGRTGFPWIDAIMRQLRREGWIHHLARHCVACFLTRGDLYISWERGADVFEELLLDADPALNVGNWLWLSASAYFSQYFRVYSPSAFPAKYKPEVYAYIRKFVPELAAVPEKHLIEPWTAPADIRKRIREAGYPDPIVDHKEASKRCIDGIAAAYKEKKYGVAPAGSWKPPSPSAGTVDVVAEADNGEGEDMADEEVVPDPASLKSANGRKRTIEDFFGGSSAKKGKKT
ncbi:putative photolyase class 1 [Hyaloraphidium curvatum]|nr:putative photolyase class 1 [Hyaloraphidium curvatum]